MKLKRKPIITQYAAEIEELYASEPAPARPRARRRGDGTTGVTGDRQ